MSGCPQTPTPIDPGGLWSESETRSVLQAAQACQRPTLAQGCGGMSWEQIKARRQRDPAFEAAWDASRQVWLDSLAAVTEAKARDGWDEVELVEVFDEEGEAKPKERRTRSKWDPRLAMGVLAAQRPQTWGKRETVEHEIVQAVPVQVVLRGAQPEPPADAHPAEGEEGAA